MRKEENGIERGSFLKVREFFSLAKEKAIDVYLGMYFKMHRRHIESKKRELELRGDEDALMILKMYDMSDKELIEALEIKPENDINNGD